MPPPPGTPYGPPYGPPPPPYDPGTVNTNAVVSLATGLLGLSVIGVGFGIAALVQIRRRRERGRGMAIAGIVGGLAWLVASIGIVATVVASETSESTSGGGLYPDAGECFNVITDERHIVTDCDGPHDAEMILTYVLPDQDWPGEEEVFRRGLQGCEQRFLTRYRTRMPIEQGEPYAFYPRRIAWRVGDRRIHCAIAAIDGEKLTGPIGQANKQVRALVDLRPGDCFTKPKDGAIATKVMKCAGPHDAQLTHRFELPEGPYPGDAATEKKADTGCGTRWDSMFARNPPRVRVEQWFLHPSKESWAMGDRLILCYVTGVDNRPLPRSVVPK